MKHTSTAAMLLAAGRGERMRPLTDTCPKPLLQVHGKPLMQWHLEALAQGGFTRAVVNTAWLGDQITAYFQSVFAPKRTPSLREQLCNQEQITLQYSHEGRDFGTALETAGGICRALPLLCPPPHTADSDVFWVLAGDVFVPGFEFTQDAVKRFVASAKLAHLWLVHNPAHHLEGDFGIDPGTDQAINLSTNDPRPRYTYSSIGLYHRALFASPWCDIAPGNPKGLQCALAPLLRPAIDCGKVSAEMYEGDWTDVGTPERLEQIRKRQINPPEQVTNIIRDLCLKPKPERLYARVL